MNDRNNGLPIWALFAVLIFAAILAFSCGTAKKADAAPLQYAGALELRSPVFLEAPGFSSWSPDIRYLDLAGNLRVFQPGSPLSFWVAGEHSFAYGFGVHENKTKVGFDLLVSQRHPITLFTFWDHRFDTELDRVFVGARFGFHGSLR